MLRIIRDEYQRGGMHSAACRLVTEKDCDCAGSRRFLSESLDHIDCGLAAGMDCSKAAYKTKKSENSKVFRGPHTRGTDQQPPGIFRTQLTRVPTPGNSARLPQY